MWVGGTGAQQVAIPHHDFGVPSSLLNSNDCLYKVSLGFLWAFQFLSIPQKTGKFQIH